MDTRYYSGIIALCVLGAAAFNNDNNTGNHQPPTANTIEADAILPENCYKRLEGSIAGQPVVMHLQKAGNYFNAMYSYTKQGRWIALNYVADSSTKDKIFFYEYAESNLDMNGGAAQNNSLICSYKNGSLHGQWISGDKSKQYEFELKDRYPEGAYQFTMLSFSDSAVAFANDQKSPIGKISEYFVQAKGNDDKAAWVNEKLEKILYIDSAFKNLSIENAIKKSNADYLISYKKDTKEMEHEEFVATLNYESMQEVSVRYNEKGYVIFESMAYDYSGGAHGNSGSALYCLDVTNKKHLQLRDIITADSSQLKPLLEKNFRLQAHLSPNQLLTEYLFENNLPPNDNFYFTDKGIGFIYNPYEIAAYAIGQINIFIPYTDLRSYIKPDFAKRIGL